MTYHTTNLNWRIWHTSGGDTLIKAGAMKLATVHHDTGMFRCEAEANAKLIEKSPELLDACFNMLNHMPKSDRRDEIVELLRKIDPIRLQRIGEMR